MRITFEAHGIEVSDYVREAIERKVRLALTRYAPTVRKLVVTLGDDSNDLAGPATSCYITVRFNDGREARAAGRARHLVEAAAAAAQRAHRMAGRMLENADSRI